jgi:hypothetical protein
MPDLEVSSPASGIAPISVDNSSTVELPPSGSPDAGGSQPAGKLTEAQIVESFNKPNTQSAKQEVKPEIKTGIEEVPVEQTEEEKAAELAKEEAVADDAVEMTPEEDISIAKINQYIKEIPELKQAFDKNPSVRNSFYAMARRSSRLSEYQEILPSPEAAKFAAQNSEAMVSLNEAFFSEDPQVNGSFWQALYDNSLLKDPTTGEVVVDKQTGQPISTGAYERVTGAYRQALYADLESIAGRITNPEEAQKLKDAIDVIGQVTGDIKKANPVQQQLPDDIKQRLSKADQLEQQLKQQQQQQMDEHARLTTSTIVSTIKDDITGHVDRMVKANSIALTAYEQKNVVNDIFKELDRLASENRQYQLHFDSLSKRAPLTEAGRKSLVAEARKFAKDNLASVTLKVIREATTSTVQKTNDANTKRVEQASKKEPKTSGGAPNTGNSHQSVKEKAAAMQKQLGRRLTQDEILAL